MRKMKVLVAEDDADDRFVFDSFLGKRQDIELLPFAENGLDVFAFLDAQQSPQDLPDMIILDHNMPKMNGRQTLELLKQNARYKYIPVFIYSTYADALLTDSCMAVGATRVVTKPITEEGYNVLMDDFLYAVRKRE